MLVDILAQSALILSLVSMGSGVSVLIKNTKDVLFWSFFALTFCISLWSFFFFLYQIYTYEIIYYFYLLANIWIAPIGLIFIYYLVKNRVKLNYFLFFTSLCASILITAMITFNFHNVRFLKSIVYLTPAFLMLQILYLFLLDLGVIKNVDQQSNIRWTSIKRKLVYGGALLVFLLPTMDSLKSFGVAYSTIGNLLVAIYIFFLGRSLSQIKFRYFSIIVSRFLLVVSMALALTFIYLGVFSLAGSNFPVLFLYSFFVSFLMLTCVDPLRLFIATFVDKAALIGYSSQYLEYKAFEKKLEKIVTVKDLKYFLLHLSNSFFNSSEIIFFYMASGAVDFQSDERDDSGEYYKINASQPIVSYFNKLKNAGETPVIIRKIIESEYQRSLSRDNSQSLALILDLFEKYNSQVAIPIFFEKDLLGIVFLKSQDELEYEWGLMRLVYPLFEKTAYSLRHQEAYLNLREKERLAELGELSAGLAHEIRNPLGAIKGAAQLLKEVNSNHYVDIVIEEVDRLNNVVTQFLDYAKNYKSDFSSVDVVEMTQKTLFLFKQSFGADIEVEFKYPVDKSQIFIKCNPVQIQQVLFNLIKNSVSALNNKESPKIVIEVKELEKNEVILSVLDNGVGINSSVLSKVFTPFFTTSSSGVGLGLSISQRIINEHKGKIAVQSKENEFTKVELRIPV